MGRREEILKSGNIVLIFSKVKKESILIEFMVLSCSGEELALCAQMARRGILLSFSEPQLAHLKMGAMTVLTSLCSCVKFQNSARSMVRERNDGLVAVVLVVVVEQNTSIGYEREDPQRLRRSSKTIREGGAHHGS